MIKIEKHLIKLKSGSFEIAILDKLDEIQEMLNKKENEYIELLEKEIYPDNLEDDESLSFIFSSFTNKLNKNMLIKYSFNDLIRIFVYGIGKYSDIDDFDEIESHESYKQLQQYEELEEIYKICKSYYNIKGLIEIYDDDIGKIAYDSFTNIIHILEIELEDHDGGENKV